MAPRDKSSAKKGAKKGTKTSAKSRAKSRADILVAAQGLAESRTRAQALILAGLVYVGERKILKAGEQLAGDTALTVRGKDHPWVSRGGLKLAHGLEAFEIKLEDRLALDIGASTGGFTDVLLAGGAAHVIAVDVGHGQLAWKLRQDDRVTVMERTNARYLTEEDIPDNARGLIDLIVCDASFISLKTVLPAAMRLVAPGTDLIALIKPQFEVGKGRVGKGGVVRDPGLHKDVCDDISGWLAAQPGWHVLGITESPITGPEGNVEFLIGAHFGGTSGDG